MRRALRKLSLALPLFLSLSCSTSDGNTSLEGAGPENPNAFIPKAGDAPAATGEKTATDAVENSAKESANEIISLEAKRFDCSRVSQANCDPDEPSNAFRCALVQNNNLLIADDQQISARGESRCFAKSTLESKLCDAKILMNGGIIECHPDTAPLDECSAALEDCDKAPAVASKCYAKEIGSGDVTWTNRPEAWGKSECEARNKLKKIACDRGIAPSEMKAVACEKEASPLVCPPIQQNCLVATGELVECRIQKIGDVPLREALKGIGASACEASYRVKDLACRWQRKEITELNDVECRSISKGEKFPPSTAKAKIYKKVRRL